MHELSIAMNILETAAQEAQRRHAGRVVAIHVRLGPLSGVVSEALESAFDLARSASPFPDSSLQIEEVAVAAYCLACAAERPVVSPQEIRCAVCGTPTPQIVRGRELEITALEIADESANTPG